MMRALISSVGGAMILQLRTTRSAWHASNLTNRKHSVYLWNEHVYDN
jgi:hypothetical protein